VSAAFGTPDPTRLAALVFELASQLHVERAHRTALEQALLAAGVITPELLGQAEVEARDATSQALDRSVRALIRVMAESDDARLPLRGKGEEG
jgi:hypothetical protein